jgi:hypothetical protein
MSASWTYAKYAGSKWGKDCGNGAALRIRSVGARREEQIDQLAIFDKLLRVVFPANAWGNRARVLTRELRASGRHRKKHSSIKL